MKSKYLILLLALGSLTCSAQNAAVPTVNKVEYGTRINTTTSVTAPKASAFTWHIPNKEFVYYDGSDWYALRGLTTDTASTVDSLNHTIDIYTPADEEAGLLELTIIAKDTSGIQAAIGRLLVAYADTGAGPQILRTTLDASPGQSSGYTAYAWSIAVVSGKLRLTYNGKNGTKSLWKFIHRVIK